METFTVDLYLRVSTDRQANEGDSLEEQENELRKFCEYRGFRIHHVFIERGKSGGNTNRPEYQKMIKDIKNNKINAVVVKKLDRLSRSLMDFEQLMKLMQENTVEFISIKENFDTTNALGKAMLRVALVFAQLEREQTSERLIDVLAYRASQGLRNGGINPFGYTNINKELVPYKKEKDIIEVIFNHFLESKSTTLVSKFLNETGYRNRNGNLWDKKQIHKILHNPVYVGKVKWNDDLYPGIHPPLISAKCFEQVQAIFKRQQRIGQDSKTNAILQRLIFCGHCGSPMTPSHSINRHKVKYYYYRCTSTNSSEKGLSKCTVKNAPLKEAEKRLTQFLLMLSEEEHFKSVENRALKHNQSIEKELQAIKEETRLLEKKQEQVKDKKDRYFDSLISGQFSSAERSKINKRIDEMELEEKQVNAELYKKQFDATQKEEELIDLTGFKQILISFKTDYEEEAVNIRDYITKHVEKIMYYPDRLLVDFKMINWTVELVI